MKDISQYFCAIGNVMISQDVDVSWCRLMSGEGIGYKGKNFAFYWTEKNMAVFRLGKGFDLQEYGIDEWKYFNPFTTKPPMKGWYVIGSKYKEYWNDLAHKALDHMKSS